MYMRLHSLTRYFCSLRALSKTRNMNNEKCYFRHVPTEDKIDITFLLKIKESVRQFNFSRKPTETLQTLFSRINTNVQKAFNKAHKKKSINDEIYVSLLNPQDGTLCEKSSCMDLFNVNVPVQIKIYNQIYEAVFNPPWVLSLNLPQCILVGFQVYPENFSLQYAEKNTSTFSWYASVTATNEKGNEISEIHMKWDLVGEGFTYTPKTCDIGRKLKFECIPGNEITKGPVVEVISKKVVEAGPGICPFENRHKFTASKLQDKSFRCVTYNILADLYCDSDYTRTVLYPYCPPYALDINYRKLLILKELIGYNADIICLQEVDVKIFNYFLKPLLGMEGLESTFSKKGKDVAEGLAVFFRRDRFSCLGEERIILSEAIKNEPCLRQIWEGIKDNKPLIDRLLDRSTAASATFLQSVEHPSELLIVGNTHLYFHPDSDHIRVIQGGICIYWINEIRRAMSRKFPDKRVSIIFCGDFNSVPSCGIYQLYTTGVAHSSLPDWKSNKEEAVENLSLHQDTLLESACGTPQFTNFTAGFAGCLDYIYYDKANLKVEQVVPFPSVEELQANTALPSVVFPSDHIALISDLRYL